MPAKVLVFRFIIVLIGVIDLSLVVGESSGKRPNVIIVITDDQGYGDIAAHGNTMIRTPNIDRLWSESVRLTNYHVDPTCAPTRAALMSGRYSTRTGVWHTILGRSLMRPEEVTLAEMFRANGYRTAMFGKWHLGDNYPCRPQDQGFDYVVMHGGGGIGQTPDYWGNDYFDDTYWRNGKLERFKGYCTDVWFDEAIKFIERNKGQPFFVYLSPNAPHAPYLVADRYWKPYAELGVPREMARFYGMITKIDENLGRLRAKIEQLGIANNTILIFTTDNGSAFGVISSKGAWKGFNAGMRGHKGSEYDGGHRVPFFIYWPNGKLTGGRDVDLLSAHIDVLPTLADLCGIKRPSGPPLDGVSLKAALLDDRNVSHSANLRSRILFVHSQRVQYPQKWRQCAVMTERWRLINGKELYDIESDPGQSLDVAVQYPEVVGQLRQAYESWWESLKPAFDDYVRISLGSDAENPVRLTAHDWHCEESKDCPWDQSHIQQGLIGNGPWAVSVERDGRYEISLYRWPKQLNKPMDCVKARLRIGEVDESKSIKPDDTHTTFKVRLARGPAMLQTWLTRSDGKTHGAYFVYVRRLD